MVCITLVKEVYIEGIYEKSGNTIGIYKNVSPKMNVLVTLEVYVFQVLGRLSGKGGKNVGIAYTVLARRISLLHDRGIVVSKTDTTATTGHRGRVRFNISINEWPISI